MGGGLRCLPSRTAKSVLLPRMTFAEHSEVSGKKVISADCVGEGVMDNVDVGEVEGVREAEADGVVVLHKPLKPAALRALLAQWRAARL